ncbi:hypothetical protein [Kamptonema sp. UHCC 0994]|uniref:hypothetical protein n=1 Tax=Kamptonema sp. UHCC 0994 TaxID=3031329 RepID=UPI0023BAE1A3|nr:hypothetical protein [Kamptonema sp. UHCC 0994]MDF0556400.1 hypothetical protein [Kamptonema sp. UHCC 0994]
MTQFAIKFQKDTQVRYAIKKTQGNPEYNGIDVGTLEDAKIWKTERGAKKYLETHVLIGRQGERLRAGWTSIEVVEISPQQQWQANNPEVIRKAKAKYDSKRPILSFRPKPEILKWLEKERSPNETDANLLNRKLEKLMKLEQGLNS